MLLPINNKSIINDAHFVFCFLFVVINLFPLLVHTQETLAECGAAIRLKSTVGPRQPTPTSECDNIAARSA